MTKSAWQAASLCIVLLLTCSPLMAGVVFEMETTHHMGSGSGGPEGSQILVEGMNAKIEMLSGTETSAGETKDEFIFRGDSDKPYMLAINHEQKEYMKIDEEGVRSMGGQMRGSMGGQMDQVMKGLEDTLKGLDPQQREMMEKMLKDRMTTMAGPPTTPQHQKHEFRQTGERATKQGYPSVRYEVLRGGEKIQELWVTDWQNIRHGKEVRDAFQKMGAFHRKLMDAFQETLGPGAGLFGADHNPMESFTQVDGFPVVMRNFEGGNLESETVLKSVKERALGPVDFAPPKDGYRLRTIGP